MHGLEKSFRVEEIIILLNYFVAIRAETVCSGIAAVPPHFCCCPLCHTLWLRGGDNWRENEQNSRE